MNTEMMPKGLKMQLHKLYMHSHSIKAAETRPLTTLHSLRFWKVMNFTLLFLAASIALAMGDSAMYDRVQGRHGYMTKLSMSPVSKRELGAKEGF